MCENDKSLGVYVSAQKESIRIKVAKETKDKRETKPTHPHVFRLRGSLGFRCLRKVFWITKTKRNTEVCVK